MAKIRLTTVQKTANVLMLDMTPATILRIGKCATILQQHMDVKNQFDPETGEEYELPFYDLSAVEPWDQQEIAKFIMEIHDALLYGEKDGEDK